MARKILVTGSAGHLGEALCRTIAQTDQSISVVGLDILPSPFTTIVGSVSDRTVVQKCLQDGVDTVLHTASLHKPHVATHSKEQFIETNITGTLVLLEEAVAAGVLAFIFTSTTSIFGDALRPPKNEPAVWIDEQVKCIPKNIYGVTKNAAEDLCRLFHRNHGLPCIVLRMARFFPEEDDDPKKRSSLTNNNLKMNEFLNRRGSIDDMARAHLCASKVAKDIGFGLYICSATSPFQRNDGELARLRKDAASVVSKYCSQYTSLYRKIGWNLDDDIDRVYDNSAARRDLHWEPRDSFLTLLTKLEEECIAGVREPNPLSHLARTIGCKGYHTETFQDGPYPT